MSSAEQIEVDDQAPATGILDPLFQRIFVVNLAEHDEIYSFEDKLSRQSSWTKGYAQRVVNEYRRFLYLTQVSEVPIAPSDAVDQAWHLHLLQTHFYWNVLCKDILGKFWVCQLCNFNNYCSNLSCCIYALFRFESSM